MSGDDTADLRDLRAKKREELLKQATGDTQEDADETPSEPIHITGPDHFQEITGTHRVVLVDFHAEWCGPCEVIEPIVAHLASETPAVVAKVDIDQHPELAQRANVRGVPTLLVYSNGEPVERLVGVQDEGTLRSLIEQYT